MFGKEFVVALGVVACASGAWAQSGKKSSGGSSSTKLVVEVPSCSGLAFTGPQMECSCDAGGSLGSVWGSGPYTADSNMCTAAQHAGVIGDGGGVISLIERPGQSSYSGSSANGVTTSDWGSYGQSYIVAAAGGEAPAAEPLSISQLPICGAFPAGEAQYVCYCPAGEQSGSLWGNDPYTADSAICAAAVHSGYIDENGGDVYVLGLGGLDEYYGDENNGVTSGSWGSYGESFVFDRNR